MTAINAGSPSLCPVTLACVAGGRMLDAEAGQVRQNGGKVHLWDGQGQQALNQRWWLEDAGEGHVRIRCAASGLVLDATSQELDRNTGRVQLYQEIAGAGNQLWRVFEEAPGEFSVRNKANGKALDADGFRVQHNGCGVQMYDWNHAPNQKWRLVVHCG